MNRGPAMSIPTLVKESLSSSLKLGMSPAGGFWYGLPYNFLQHTQLNMILLTSCLPRINQYLVLSSANVSFTPLCLTLTWQFLTISSVTWWFEYNDVGCFISYGKYAFAILPLLLIIPLVSTNNPRLCSNCFNCMLENLCCISLIQTSSASTVSSAVKFPDFFNLLLRQL